MLHLLGSGAAGGGEGGGVREEGEREVSNTQLLDRFLPYARSLRPPTGTIKDQVNQDTRALRNMYLPIKIHVEDTQGQNGARGGKMKQCIF